MTEEDDAVQVALCLKGDASAFEPIVARYQKVLFNVALRMLGDREDARDVTQISFVKAWQHLDSYDPSHRFFSWLYRIMVNESLNLIARRRRQVPLDANLPSPERADREAEADEQMERLRTALLALPRESREVLVLRHFSELSYHEIAWTLGIPEKTVKSRLFTARQRLGEFFEGGGRR
jgi:RNA polymerase sigma-70 factor (ECF subfamily)